MNTPTEATRQQRKFFLVLPLLVLPFLTLAFWALGGGQGTPFSLPTATESSGLSLTLPDPQFKKAKEMNKLSLYEQARRGLSKPGSGQEGEALATPDMMALAQPALSAGDSPVQHLTFPNHPADKTVLPAADAKEAEINQRLAQLSALASTTPPGPAPPASPLALQPAKRDNRFSEDVSRLETLMQRMASPGAPNPEMQQMETLLERILDIQHPERLQAQREEHARAESPPAQLLGMNRQGAITLLEAPPPPSRGQTEGMAQPAEAAAGFYPLQTLQPPPQAGGNAVEAVIPTTQTLQPGSLVRLRLLEDLPLTDQRIPRGSFVYGTCRLRGERLAIEINAVLSGKTSLAVALSAYDLDGQEGLHIPGSNVQEAARQGAGRALQQSLQLPTLAPSVGAQATSAGIATARDLLNRQTRQVKVTVKAGHRLLLQNR